MNETTARPRSDGASPAGSSDSLDREPGHSLRRRTFLTVGAVATLAVGAGAGAFAFKSGAFAAKDDSPKTSTFTGATDTITKGDLQGETSVTGTLRYSEPHKLKAGFEGRTPVPC